MIEIIWNLLRALLTWAIAVGVVAVGDDAVGAVAADDDAVGAVAADDNAVGAFAVGVDAVYVVDVCWYCWCSPLILDSIRLKMYCYFRKCFETVSRILP